MAACVCSAGSGLLGSLFWQSLVVIYFNDGKAPVIKSSGHHAVVNPIYDRAEKIVSFTATLLCPSPIMCHVALSFAYYVFYTINEKLRTCQEKIKTNKR